MNNQQLELLNQMIKTKQKEYILFASLIPFGLKLWNKILIKYKVNNVLELNDGYIVLYKSYNKVLDEFIDYKLDSSLFLIKFADKIYKYGNNFIRTITNKSHHILNNYLPIDQIYEKIKDPIVNDANTFWIDDYLSWCKPYYRDLIRLKYKGYTNYEISNILHINSKKVENDLYFIRKKAQSLFNIKKIK